MTARNTSSPDFENGEFDEAKAWLLNTAYKIKATFFLVENPIIDCARRNLAKKLGCFTISWDGNCTAFVYISNLYA